MLQEAGVTRLLGIYRRRRWAVLLTAFAVATVGILAVAMAPETYRARAVVRLDDPRPAREYVAHLVNEPTAERLRSRRVTFLARPLVAAAAEKAGFLRPDTDEATREKIIAGLAARLDARQEGEDTFVLTFSDRDRGQAQAFLAALAAEYGAVRAKEGAEHTKKTAEFFGRQVEELRPRVADAEAVVEKYRLEHYGALPDQLEANLRMLDETQMEMHSLTTSLDSAAARRREILGEARSALRRQEEEAARRLSEARARYAPTSGEVKNLEAELARVRAERARDEAELDGKVKGSAELRLLASEVQLKHARLGELRKREKELLKRVHQAAKNGEVLARLALDRDVLRDRLRSLVAKHEEARLAAGMEADVSGVARVSVIEPAWASAGAVEPNKPLLAGLVLLVACLLGLAVGYLLEVTDRRVHSVDDVVLVTGDLPILGTVPDLGKAASRALNPRGERPQA